jgi:hypothetical protein
LNTRAFNFVGETRRVDSRPALWERAVLGRAAAGVLRFERDEFSFSVFISPMYSTYSGLLPLLNTVKSLPVFIAVFLIFLPRIELTRI